MTDTYQTLSSPLPNSLAQLQAMHSAAGTSNASEAQSFASILREAQAGEQPEETESAVEFAANDELGTEDATQPTDEELREVFDQFVGETFFTQLMKSMRATVGKPAYFHGGRAEEIFRSQLDQNIVESIASQSGDDFSQGMFELFQGRRG